MELYNTTTRAQEPIDDPEALQQALLTGTHSFKAGTKIPVVDPDGNQGEINAEGALEAIQAGYKIQTPSQIAVQNYVNDNDGIKGAAKVALESAANQFSLGVNDVVLNKFQDPLERAKDQALAKEHNYANVLGGLAGLAGITAATGGFGPVAEAGAAATGATEAATKFLGSKILGEAGGALTSRVANSTAGKVLASMGGAAAKGVGGLTEGALLAAPQAITEAALGNPDDAAETLMAGGGIGAVLGAGGGLAKDLLGLSKNAILKGSSLVSQQQENLNSIARKIAKTATGVNESDVLHYMENMDRVNASPELELTKNDIDGSVGKYRTDMEQKLEASRAARSELDEAYRGKVRDLSQMQAPTHIADSLMGAIEGQKATLGDLSRQADEALVSSGYVAPKSDVLSLIDKQMDTLGVGKNKVLVGDEAKAAYNKLNSLKSQIEGMEDNIEAPVLRDVLQNVRKDINFDHTAGAFSETTDKLRKQFTNDVSGMLKGVSPEYAGLMDQMRGISDNLSDMSKNFGTREKALSSLNKMISPKGELKADLLQKFSEVTGFDWTKELEAFKNSKDLLEASRRGDIREQLLPELALKAKQAEQEYVAAQETYKPIKRLTENNTQAIIRRQGFKNASIEDRKALETLGQYENKDFLTQIKDRNVLDEFQKERPQGSKRTNLFGIIGSTIGGLVGGPVGAGVGASLGASAGASLDSYGGRVLKKLIDMNKDVAGVLFSERAMKEAAQKLDKIPAVIKNMSSAARSPSVRPLGTDVLLRLHEKNYEQKKKETPLKDRVEHLDKFNKEVSQWVSNPQALTDHISAITSGLSNRGAPAVGGALSNKMLNTVQYINSIIPKPPKPKSIFAPKMKWRPSDFDLSAFEQKMNVIHDPFSVITNLENGTLTRNHIEALQSVYPALHERMVDKIVGAAADTPMDYSQRMKLSLILGQPLDDSTSPQSINYYQSTFAEQGSGGGGPGEAASSTPPFKANINISSDSMTQTDKMINKA